MKIKRVKLYNLELTLHELVHFRDMMSLMLPPYGERTVSAALADVEGRSCVDGSLWSKLVTLCDAAHVPTGSSAPDYVISIVESPTIGIVPINLSSEMVEDDLDESDDVDLPETGPKESDNSCVLPGCRAVD